MADGHPTTCAGLTRRAAAILVLLVMPFAAGCGAKVVRTPVFDQDGTRVFLRSREKSGEPIERNFAHPATISSVRLTAILSRLEARDLDDEERERQPALPTAVLFPLGDGISDALEQADSTQEVVAMAVERRRNLGIFNSDYLTSLVVWVAGERLNIHMGQVDDPISKDPKEKVREPQINDAGGPLRALPGDGIVPLGPKTWAVEWRDPIFRKADALRVRPGGQIIRRTILMESPEETGAAEEGGEGAVNSRPDALPVDLSPEMLRALADLEEERRRGEISESVYQTRRRLILDPAPEAPPE